MILTTPTAQELLNKGSGIDYVLAATEPGVSQAELAKTLRSIVSRDLEVVTGKTFVAENEGSVSRVIELFTQPILAFGFISVFVGAFVIYNTFSIIVAQRTRELALLRAVGAGRTQVLGSVMLEAVVIGLVASTLGILAGWLLATGIKGAIGASITLPPGAPALTLDAVVVGLLVGIVATTVSAAIPAMRATRIAPVAAIASVAIDRSDTSRGRRLLGALLLVAGTAMIVATATQAISLGLAGVGTGAVLMFLSLATLGPLAAAPMSRALGSPLPALRGIAGVIGRENAARNPKRTTVTAVALSVGVSLVVVVTVLAASIRSATQNQLSNQLRNVDLVVDAGTGFATLGPEAAAFMRSRPEVARVNAIRYSPVMVLNSKDASAARADKGPTEKGNPVGESEFVVGLDPSTAFKVANFEDLTPPISTLRTNEVMVLKKVADENGWKPGDTIRVWFARTGEQRWRLAATFSTLVGTGAEYMTSIQTLSPNAPKEIDGDATLWVTLRDGVSPDQAVRAIRPELKKVAPAAAVNTLSAYLTTRLAILDSITNLIYVLLGLSIVIALVGVANTISLSIHERTRELGLLRAVGMSRGQLAESVRWESAIIALVGTVVGLAAGIVLSIIFVRAFDQPGVVPVVNPPAMLLIGALGAAAGVLAAIGPARRATRVDVLSAIATT
ncbi:MAG: FtsX-like permease family protein [Microthrixaceae bacterium]